MKKYLYILCCLMSVMMTRKAYAQSEVAFSISPVNVVAGKTSTVNLDVINPDADVASAVFAIKLPEGFAFVTDGEGTCSCCVLSERAVTGFAAEDNYMVASNTLYVVVNGMGHVLNGRQGPLASFKIKSIDDAVSGTIEVSGLSWSNADGTVGGDLPGFSADLKVTDAVLLGDANGDGVINILDVLATLSIIKGETGEFNTTAADANESGSVDILDVLKILEIIKQQ